MLIIQMQDFQIADPFDKDPPTPIPDINKLFSVKFSNSPSTEVVIAFLFQTGR